MQIPTKIPGLKVATAIMAAYTAVWISLEGQYWRATLMAFLVTLVSLALLVQRLLGGRSLSYTGWLACIAIVGLLVGLGSSGLTLLFMGVKTGLHAHGPEFTPTEISWALGRIPAWSLAGLSGGLGIGLVTGKYRA